MSEDNQSLQPNLLTNEDRNGTFVVVSAYNESTCIADVLTELRASYSNVVLVDDGSTDNTFEVGKGIARYALRHLVNRGQGAALQTGIRFALSRGAKYIVSFDGDGQHSVADIAKLVAPLARKQADVVIGSRFLDNTSEVPTGRRMTLRLAIWFTRLVNRVPATDAHNGLRAFSATAARKIDLTLDRMAHASELIDQIRQSGMTLIEVPVHIRYTEYSLKKGQSARGAVRIVIHYILGRVFS